MWRHGYKYSNRITSNSIIINKSMEKQQLEEKIKKYQAEHQKAVQMIQSLNTQAVQLEGAILACQEMIKEEEDAKKEKS